MIHPRREGQPLPQVLVVLFRPARWWRRHWPELWLRLVMAAVALAVVAAILGSWMGMANQRSWDHWLANFRFSGSGARAATPEAQSSCEKRLRVVRREPLPTYLGDGRAELGDYSVRVFDPITQSTLRTDFRLEGKTTLDNQTAFEDFMGRNQQFFREQVAVVLRTHNSDELASPDLGLLSRKIVARVNRSLGERVLDSVQIKDFSLHESVEGSGFALRELGVDDR